MLHILQKLLQCSTRKPPTFRFYSEAPPIYFCHISLCISSPHSYLLLFHVLSPFCPPPINLPSNFHQSFQFEFHHSLEWTRLVHLPSDVCAKQLQHTHTLVLPRPVLICIAAVTLYSLVAVTVLLSK